MLSSPHRPYWDGDGAQLSPDQQSREVRPQRDKMMQPQKHLPIVEVPLGRPGTHEEDTLMRF